MVTPRAPARARRPPILPAEHAGDSGTTGGQSLAPEVLGAEQKLHSRGDGSPTTILTADRAGTILKLVHSVSGRRSDEVVGSCLHDFVVGDGVRERSVALLELAMPRLDGRATLRELRRVGATFPVILVSGHDLLGSPERLADLDVSGSLQKPFRCDDLVRALQSALDRPPPPSGRRQP